ncbi:MAG: hypothetical protein GX998_01910 [Firmicutes bacterium]|nr:hypothetical protein [Bacillota bacterium]
MVNINVIVLILASILCGFAVGRRLGIKQGFHIGMAYGVLDLRQQCLEQNRCPICNSKEQEKYTDAPQDSSDMLSVCCKPVTYVLEDEFDGSWLQDVVH